MSDSSFGSPSVEEDSDRVLGTRFKTEAEADAFATAAEFFGPAFSYAGKGHDLNPDFPWFVTVTRKHPAGEGAPTDVAARITEYLSAGGLFNPEMMEHDKVRDLLIDCRAALGELASSLRSARDETETVLRMKGVVEGHVASLESELAAALSRVAELENQLRTAADMLEHEEAVNRGAFLKLREEVAAMPAWAPDVYGHNIVYRPGVLSLLDRATTTANQEK